MGENVPPDEAVWTLSSFPKDDHNATMKDHVSRMSSAIEYLERPDSNFRAVPPVSLIDPPLPFAISAKALTAMATLCEQARQGVWEASCVQLFGDSLQPTLLEKFGQILLRSVSLSEFHYHANIVERIADLNDLVEVSRSTGEIGLRSILCRIKLAIHLVRREYARESDAAQDSGYGYEELGRLCEDLLGKVEKMMSSLPEASQVQSLMSIPESLSKLILLTQGKIDKESLKQRAEIFFEMILKVIDGVSRNLRLTDSRSPLQSVSWDSELHIAGSTLRSFDLPKRTGVEFISISVSEPPEDACNLNPDDAESDQPSSLLVGEKRMSAKDGSNGVREVSRIDNAETDPSNDEKPTVTQFLRSEELPLIDGGFSDDELDGLTTELAAQFSDCNVAFIPRRLEDGSVEADVLAVEVDDDKFMNALTGSDCSDIDGNLFPEVYLHARRNFPQIYIPSGFNPVIG